MKIAKCGDENVKGAVLDLPGCFADPNGCFADDIKLGGITQARSALAKFYEERWRLPSGTELPSRVIVSGQIPAADTTSMTETDRMLLFLICQLREANLKREVAEAERDEIRRSIPPMLKKQVEIAVGEERERHATHIRVIKRTFQSQLDIAAAKFREKRKNCLRDNLREIDRAVQIALQKQRELFESGQPH